MFKDFDFTAMSQMLNEAQKKAKEFEEQSLAKEFTAKGAGGLIAAKVNGNAELIDVSIDDSLMNDKQNLQILLISVINEAINEAMNEKKNMASMMLGNLANLG